MDYFNNIAEEIPSSAAPDPTGPLDETGTLEAAGRGFMRGAADIAGAATLAVGGVVGLMEGGLFNHRDSDKVFKFYEDVIKPAQDFWTPDPESVSTADNIVGGIAGIAPALMLGPAAIPTLIGTSTFGTAVDLVDQGVDPGLATGIGILSGVSTGLMVQIPAAGKTLAKTLGLALTNPVIGALQTKAQGEILKVAGHPDIAKSFDPFDPAGRTIDLALGVIFGGMGHYAKARGELPIQVNDAIDVAAETQSITKADIIKGKNRAIHENALNDSITKLVDGEKVDLTNKVQGVEFKEVKPDADANAIRDGHEVWKRDLIDEAQGVLSSEARDEITIQREIDAIEDRLKAEGIDITKLFDPTDKRAAEILGKDPEFRAEPKELTDLLVEREALFTIEKKDFIEAIIKDSGLSKADTRKGLSGLGLTEKTLTNFFDTTLKRWDRDTVINLNELYQEFNREKNIFVEFRITGTAEAPTLSTIIRDADGNIIQGKKANIATLKKVEGVFNAIEKARGGEPIRLTTVKDQPITPRKLSAESMLDKELKQLETGPTLADSGIAQEAVVEGVAAVSSFQEPEQPLSVRTRTLEGGLEVITDPLFNNVDDFIENNPETNIYVGTDESGNPKLENAKTFIDDAKAELDTVEKRGDLYDLAAGCLLRG